MFPAEVDDLNRNREKKELFGLQAPLIKQRHFGMQGNIKFGIHEEQQAENYLTRISMEKVTLPFTTSYLAEAIFSALVPIQT